MKAIYSYDSVCYIFLVFLDVMVEKEKRQADC